MSEAAAFVQVVEGKIGLPADIASAVIAFAQWQAEWLAAPSKRPRMLTIRVEHDVDLDPEGTRSVFWTRDASGDVIAVSLVIATAAQAIGGVQ